MSDTTPSDNGHQDAEYTYDVAISLPEWADRDLIAERTRAAFAGKQEAVDQIMEAIASHRVAKVKADVSREKADKVAKKFEALGFRAEISHSLKLKKLSAMVPNLKKECPNCEEIVIPGPDTQCPNCGVYIKKLTPEYLAKKRLYKKERELAEMTLRNQQQYDEHARQREMEQRIREEVRREIERKYKINRSRNNKRLTVALGLLVTAGLAGAFWSGRVSNKSPAKLQASAELVTQQLGEDQVQKVLRQTSQLQIDMAKLSAHAPQTEGAVKIDPRDSLLASPEPATGTPLGYSSKQELTNALVLMLAEIGQVERARELTEKAVTASKISTDFDIISHMRNVQLQVESWAIVHGHTDKAQDQIEELTRLVGEIPEPGVRLLCAAEIAANLMLRPDFPEQYTAPLWRMAEAAYQLVKGKSPELGHTLLVARGRGLLNSAQSQLERGMRYQATNLVGQLDTMTRQAPDASAAMLHGFNQKLARIMGNTDGAQQNMALALKKIGQNPNLLQQAQQLRSLIELDHGENKAGQTALSALATEASRRASVDSAAILLETGQSYGKYGNDDGLRQIQSILQGWAKSTPTIAPYEERMRGLAELSLAYRAKKNGDPALMEVHLRQVAALLNQTEAAKP